MTTMMRRSIAALTLAVVMTGLAACGSGTPFDTGDIGAPGSTAPGSVNYHSTDPSTNSATSAPR